MWRFCPLIIIESGYCPTSTNRHPKIKQKYNIYSSANTEQIYYGADRTTEAMTIETTAPVKSIRTAVRVIEALERLDGAGATELAAELGIAKSTAHDHLKTLEAEEFVVNEDGVYRIGLRFLDYGGRARIRNKLYTVAKPQIEELASITGELANLVVEEHGWGVYLAVERGENAVALDTYVGKRENLHSTAVGKAILAQLPRERVEQIIERRGLPRHTPQTLTTPGELFDRLDAIREQRLAFDREENLPGLRCVAAPITTDEGTVIGGISVSGPTSRLEGDRLEQELSDQITRISNIIEINVTYA